MKKRNKSWYKPKGYLHLSHKLTELDKSKVEEYILNSVDLHNFLPLIHNTISTRKYKAYIDSKGIKYRSHYNELKKKSSKKNREIFYANHIDAHIYSYYSNVLLGERYESILKDNPLLSKCIIAYRRIPVEIGSERGKCNIHFAKEVFDYISSKKNCVAVCYDIENFFPSLDHTYLKNCWEKLLEVERLPNNHYRVYKSLTRYSYVELSDIIEECTDTQLKIEHKNDIYDADFTSYFINTIDFRNKIAKKNLIKVNRPDASGMRRGIPQGTPISAFLANLYLLEFDKFIVDNIVVNDCFYRRYSDDIVIIFNNEDEYRRWDNTIRYFISNKPYHLNIQKEKTVITKFVHTDYGIECSTKTNLSKDFIQGYPLRYLGFDFNGKQTLIKSSTISQYYSQMKSHIRKRAQKANIAISYNKRHPDRRQKDEKIYLTKLYKRYTHLGKNNTQSNFLTYVDRSAKIIYNDSSITENPIRNQLKRAWSIFRQTVKKYEDKAEAKRNKKR